MYELQQEPIEQTILIVVFLLKPIVPFSSGKKSYMLSSHAI
jgi:hypothetical protein